MEEKKLKKYEFCEKDGSVNKRLAESKTKSKGKLSHLLELLNKVKNKSQHKHSLTGNITILKCFINWFIYQRRVYVYLERLNNRY
jgi:exonuclease V gamma subunit